MPQSVPLCNLNNSAPQSQTYRLLGDGPFSLFVVFTGDAANPAFSSHTLSIFTSHDGNTWWPIGQTLDTGGVAWSVQPVEEIVSRTVPDVVLMEYIKVDVTCGQVDPVDWTALVVASSPNPLAVLDVA